MCEELEISRDSYYKWLKRKDNKNRYELNHESLKPIIKKYYELDDENKDLLYPMYLFHELENQLNEAETIDIYTIADEEKILNIAIDCSYITDLDGQEIIRRLLEILKCRDIEIDDILELTSEELKELILDINDKSNCNNDAIQVIKKFIYKDSFCVFYKYENRYFLAFDEGEDVNVIIFNNIEEILGNLIDSYLALDKKD